MKNIFVYNKESGRGKLQKYKSFIINELTKKFGEIEVRETTHQGHAEELARASVGVYENFIVAGGDGTLNEVINGFAGQENAPIISYIPCGTVNDVARSLGISRNIKKAVKNIIDGEPYKHDIFKVNDRFGIYVCCTGLFTKSSYATSRKTKKAFGKIAYFFRGIKEVFSAKPVNIKISTEEETIEKNASLVLILNSRSVAGFKLNKKAELNDGVVELVLVHSKPKKVSLSSIFKVFKTFLFGIDKVKNKSYVTYRKLASFNMEIDGSAVINLDGEKSGFGSFDFMVVKEGVQIIVSKKNGKKSKT